MKKYSWIDWEYYLSLMENHDEHDENALHQISGPTPATYHNLHLRIGEVFEAQDHHYPTWSWLSTTSPLASGGSESAWILARISRALERSLMHEWTKTDTETVSHVDQNRRRHGGHAEGR
jgi:potassium channel subfamily K